MAGVGIIYFSGTGNTWAVAQEYAQAFGEQEREVEVWSLEEVMRGDDYEALAEYELLGIGYPIHAWNAPRMVADFVRALPPSEGQRVFLFVTASASVGGALDWARDELTRRGYQVLHEAPYYTGNDLFLAALCGQEPSPDAVRRFAWLSTDVHEAVAEVLAGAERHVYGSSAERFILSTLVWRFYLLGCRNIHRHFRADSACDFCALCEETCASENVKVADGKVAFGKRCTFCLRCVNICPQKAIQIKPLTRGKGRHLAPGFREAVQRSLGDQRIAPEPGDRNP